MWRVDNTLGYSPMEGDLSDSNNSYSPCFTPFWPVLPVPILDTQRLKELFLLKTVNY